MSDIYFENISIDMTEDSVTVSYISYEGIPEIKPKRTGFTLTRPSEVSVTDFKIESLKKIQESLPHIFNKTFQNYLTQKH